MVDICMVQADLLPDEKKTINNRIELLINTHKNNRQEINRLTFECVAAMTAGDDYANKLENKKGLKRFLGGITGSNKKLQDKINSNRSVAQYASQQTLQRLAEQNLMSFDLITAVNNKLNMSLEGIEQELNEVYNTLLNFFKQSRSELISLENRVERLENNVNLLNWQNSIEYQMLDGTEYSELDNISKIVCLVRDFYDITKGEWNNSHLLLLKTAMNAIGIDPQRKTNFFELIKTLAYDDKLRERLLCGKTIDIMPDATYLIPLTSMEKLGSFGNNEKYIVESVSELLKQNNIEKNCESISEDLTEKYILQQENVNINFDVENYDLIIELLFNLRQAEQIGALKEKVAEIEAEKLELLSTLDSLTEEERLYINRSFEKAYKIFDVEVDNGNGKAFYYMGAYYFYGLEPVKANEKKAKEYWKSGYDKEDILSKVAYLLCCKRISELDEQDIISLEQLSDKNPIAKNVLANLYLQGSCVELDDEKGTKLQQEAADAGYWKAEQELGYTYVKLQKYKNALEAFKNIADRNNDIQYEIGKLYLSDNRLKQDYCEAVKWFEKAAEGGNHEAQFKFGKMLENGTGIAKDHDRAIIQYIKAAIQNNPDAIGKIKDLYKIKKKSIYLGSTEHGIIFGEHKVANSNNLNYKDYWDAQFICIIDPSTFQSISICIPIFRYIWAENEPYSYKRSNISDELKKKFEPELKKLIKNKEFKKLTKDYFESNRLEQGGISGSYIWE